MEVVSDLECCLYRVNFEVINPKPFPYLAFPRFKTQRTSSEMLSFDGELMAGSACLQPVAERPRHPPVPMTWRLTS